MKRIMKKKIKQRGHHEHVLRERLILEMAESPFIVNLHFAFQNKKAVYYVSGVRGHLTAVDFVRGGELFYLLEQKSHLSEKTVRFFSAQIVLALEHLHSKNIVYRDLKTENILLDEHGYLMLADFGLAKIVSQTDSFCGTPDYIPPEIIKRESYTRSVDWWQLGVLVFELLSGHTPFFHHDTKKMFYGILHKKVPRTAYLSPVAYDLVTKLLVKDPKGRLGNTGDAAEVKAHPFFEGVDWKKLLLKEVDPPEFLKIKDLHYFDPNSLVS